MSFQLETIAHNGRQFVQWMDVPRADGWRRECARLAREAPRSNVAQAIAQARAIARAVSAFYLATDLPPQGDPVYVRAWVSRDTGSPYQGAGAWTTAMLAALQRVSPQAREAIADDDTFTLQLVRRIDLGLRAEVRDASLGITVPPPTPRGRDFERMGCAPGGPQSIAACPIWSEWWPGAFTAADGAVVAVPSIADHYALFRDVAQAIGAAPSTASYVARARAWIVGANLVAAREAGVELPEELAGLATEPDALRQAVDPDLETAGAFGSGVAAVAVALAGPFAGALVGLLVGMPAFLQAAFGRAVGRSYDPFGRTRPVWQPSAISGSLAPRTAPTQEVPEPPVDLRGSVLVPVEVGDPRPDVTVFENESESESGGGLAIAAAVALLLALRR